MALSFLFVLDNTVNHRESHSCTGLITLGKEELMKAAIPFHASTLSLLRKGENFPFTTIFRCCTSWTRRVSASVQLGFRDFLAGEGVVESMVVRQYGGLPTYATFFQCCDICGKYITHSKLYIAYFFNITMDNIKKNILIFD